MKRISVSLPAFLPVLLPVFLQTSCADIPPNPDGCKTGSIEPAVALQENTLEELNWRSLYRLTDRDPRAGSIHQQNFAAAGGIVWILWEPQLVFHKNTDANANGAAQISDNIAYLQRRSDGSVSDGAVSNNTVIEAEALPAETWIPASKDYPIFWRGIRMPADLDAEDQQVTISICDHTENNCDSEHLYAAPITVGLESSDPIDFTDIAFDTQLYFAPLSVSCNVVNPAIQRPFLVGSIHFPSIEAKNQEQTQYSAEENIIINAWIVTAGTEITDDLRKNDVLGTSKRITTGQIKRYLDHDGIHPKVTSKNAGYQNQRYYDFTINLPLKNELVYDGLLAHEEELITAMLQDQAPLGNPDSTTPNAKDGEIVLEMIDVDHPENTHQERIPVDLSWFLETL